jgi:hypothetical protein
MKIEFNSIKELHKHLIDNKESIMMARKSAIKEADGILFVNTTYVDKDEAIKSENVSEEIEIGTINVKVVINTTNLIDSHRDCHMPKIWNKSIKENRKLKLLKEHKAVFENVISDEVTATVKTMKWSSLGYNYEGSTQALIFDAKIKEKRSPYMFAQYKEGYVDNHSVGMQYVNYVMCVNSAESWAQEEKANWDKYYSEVVNKEVADEKGYFWAVTEAKVIEGSAVVKGSNEFTPVMEIEIDKQTFNILNKILTYKSYPYKSHV